MPSGLTFGVLEYGVRTLFKNLDSFHLYRIIYRFIRYKLTAGVICLWQSYVFGGAAQ